MIKISKEIIREQLESGANSAALKFRGAVLPIYGVDRNGRPSHIGSCFLFQDDGKKYLITAAHVIDHAKKTALRVGGERGLAILEGDFNITTAPNGVREDDHYDFAWLRVTKEFYDSLGSVGVIHSQDVADEMVDLKGRVYLGLGYPRSKNKKADPTTRLLRPKRACYFSTWQDMPALYAELELTGSDHIAISRKTQSRNETGAIENSIGPRGMSGGPLIDLGGMVSVECISTGITYPAKLAGLLIAHDKKHDAILSVRFEHILNSIREYSNE